MNSPTTSSPTSASAPVPAAITTRFFAGVIDAMICMVASIILGVVLSPLLMGGTFGYVLINLIYIAAFTAYFVYFESGEKQASIGKQVMKIIVVQENGQPLDRELAIKRTGVLSGLAALAALLMFVSPMLTILAHLSAIATLLWIFTNDKRQGWHDLIAKSLVVDRK